jgi:hypothetical protein
MLTFHIEDTTNPIKVAPDGLKARVTEVQIEREALEEKFLEGILARFDELRETNQGMYNMIKSSINMLKTFGQLDINIPKGVNSLDYLIAHFLSLGMDALEQKGALAVTGKVVELE